jgi:hypothetical protein
MAATPAMQRKTVGLAVLKTILVVGLLGWRLTAAGDEGGQASGIAARFRHCLPSILDRLSPVLGLSAMLLRLAATIRLRFTRLIAFAWLVLRLVLLLLVGGPVLIGLLAAIAGLASTGEGLSLLVAIVKAAFARLLAPLAIRPVKAGIGAELLLRGRDHAEIVLRVLEIILGADRIPGRLRIAGELDVLLGNV